MQLVYIVEIKRQHKIKSNVLSAAQLNCGLNLCRQITLHSYFYFAYIFIFIWGTLLKYHILKIINGILKCINKISIILQCVKYALYTSY